MKKIALLGSTGSIGCQTLEIVREQSQLQIIALASNQNVLLMEKQIREFKPEYAVMWTESKARELEGLVADTDTKVLAGMDGLIQISTKGCPEELEINGTTLLPFGI